jgi:hypothetical protein
MCECPYIIPSTGTRWRMEDKHCSVKEKKILNLIHALIRDMSKTTVY